MGDGAAFSPGSWVRGSVDVNGCQADCQCKGFPGYLATTADPRMSLAFARTSMHSESNSREIRYLERSCCQNGRLSSSKMDISSCGSVIPVIGV